MGVNPQFTVKSFKWHFIYLKKYFLSLIITELPEKKQNDIDQHAFTHCVLTKMPGSKLSKNLG